VNLVLTLFSITTFGSVLSNIIPSEDYLPIYLATCIATLLSGLVAGKVINTIIKHLPLYHTLLVATLAAFFVSLGPRFEPVSIQVQAVFMVVAFGSIIWGSYVFRSKSA
jgi:hypothetical protein